MRLKLDKKVYFVDKVSFLGKIIGLMFSRKRNLLFDLNNKKRIIHSFFVFYPIKIYFLDERFNVVEEAVLKPFWIYLPKTKARYLVEIPI